MDSFDIVDTSLTPDLRFGLISYNTYTLSKVGVHISWRKVQ